MGAIVVGGLCALVALFVVEIAIPWAAHHWVLALFVLVTFALVWVSTRPTVVAWFREMRRAKQQRRAVEKITADTKAQMEHIAGKWKSEQ
ncbi:hypothetical protein [Umezawaea tangerina]|uniref:Uncharacterized protein n=1 Tax=Umezawaea tangerina TaxID=84725 RepID=A0A2T0T4G6_9PSEU|nr:hypothetical protein [Umezawaea tangerina]PRY40519.1 hypothetical protein CLV43_106256 [Umezawaea tangerina]